MKQNIIRSFYWLFAVCFAFVLMNVIFANKYFNTLPLVITTLVCLVLLDAIYKLLGRYEAAIEKHYKTILVIFSAAMFITELVFGLMLRHDTAFDMGAVHKGAAEWVETGTFRSYYQYFCECTNNLGPMAFLFVFFKIASIFGITDYYAVAAFITSVMLTVMMALVSLICRRIKNVKAGVLALVLFAVSVQFWFMGGAVYTDMLCMLFPVLCYWLYLKSNDFQGKKKLLIYVLMGLSAAVGCVVKFTVVIAAMAIIIDMCLTKKAIDIIKASVCFACMITVVMLGFNGYIYSKHIDKDMAEQYHRPYTHWMMMGLNGNGTYNGADFSFTDGLDPEERTEKVNAEVVNRIKALGVSGIYNLIRVKSAINFGDGTYGIGDFLGMYPQKETKLNDWVMYDGAHYNIYSTYATALHIALMLIMLFNSFVLALKKSDKGNGLLVSYLMLLGVWLFLLCWETNRRYFSNFAPMIFICASVGMYTFNDWLHSVKERFKNKTAENI